MKVQNCKDVPESYTPYTDLKCIDSIDTSKVAFDLLTLNSVMDPE